MKPSEMPFHVHEGSIHQNSVEMTNIDEDVATLEAPHPTGLNKKMLKLLGGVISSVN